MDLFSRVQAILTKPKDEWAKIKDEPTTIQQLFMRYALILAAVPVVAQFIGLAIGGFRVPYIGGTWMGRAIISLIFSYVLSLVATYAFGFIINALAPSFGSQQNPANAMKLAVYSMTPIWVAGILHIIGFWGPLYWLVTLVMIAAAVYSIYVLYLGFAVPLLGTPKDKIAGYLIVSAVVAIVLFAVIAIILGAVFAMRGMMRFF
jgi:hypothetical protein